MLHHQDVRLVAAHRRKHVVRFDGGREAFGLTERGHRLVVAAELRQRDARERLDQREVTPIAGGKKRRRGFRDVLADDRRVADLAVTLAELVVRETDRLGVVRGLGLFERAAVQGDGARLIAAQRGEASVQAPQCRQPAAEIVSRKVSGARPSAVAA